MLEKHSKREERRHGAAPYSLSVPRPCVISLPLVAFTASKQPNLNALHPRLVALAFPPHWLLASYQQESHLTICKVITAPPLFQAIVQFSVTISDQLSWSLFVGQCLLEPSKCPALASQPHVMDSAAQIMNLMQLLDCCSICIGNTEAGYLKVFSYRLTTPHGKHKNSQNMIYAYVYLSFDYNYYDCSYIRILFCMFFRCTMCSFL